jgi:3-methyladenine DNA glycosylase AlkD
MASLAMHDKKAPDEKLLMFMPAIFKGATDERNFVRKAVNWELRQIGKRSIMLNKEAIALSERMLTLNGKSAKWIATDALKELKSPEKQARLIAKGK